MIITKLDTLKTGDIVLFSGRCWVSYLIRILTLSKWSHIGMIVIDKRYPEPLIYESSNDDSMVGLDLGKRNKGVKISFYNERVKNYKGDVAVRKLQGVKFNEQHLNKLTALRMELVGRPYEKSLKEMFLSLFKWTDKTYTGLLSIFCSELIAKAYVVLELLPDTTVLNNYVPKGFSSKSKLRLLRGYLSNEIYVKELSRKTV